MYKNTHSGDIKNRKRIYVVAFIAFAVFVVPYVINLIWRYSGDGEWRLVMDKDNVKVYGKKVPGHDLKNYKGVLRLNTTLSGVVALYSDPSTCEEWMPGCHDGEDKVTMNKDNMYYIHSYQQDFPGPFRCRELWFKHHFYQNPESKQLVITISSTPIDKPENPECYTGANINNVHTFTSLGNGVVEANIQTDADFGGYVPDLLVNYMKPKSVQDYLSKMQHYLDKDKYQTAKYDFIEEPDMGVSKVANTAIED